MKTRLLLALLLVAGCASKDGFIDRQQFECEPGQVVSILAGLDAQGSASMEGVMDDQHTLLVLVGNNSHEDMVVKTIRAEQAAGPSDTYRFNNAYRTVNQTIPEGKEAEIKIPMTGRPIASEFGERNVYRSVSMAVTVALGNGDSYRCLFEIRAR